MPSWARLLQSALAIPDLFIIAMARVVRSALHSTASCGILPTSEIQASRLHGMCGGRQHARCLCCMHSSRTLAVRRACDRTCLEYRTGLELNLCASVRQEELGTAALASADPLPEDEEDYEEEDDVGEDDDDEYEEEEEADDEDAPGECCAPNRIQANVTALRIVIDALCMAWCSSLTGAAH